VAICKTCGKLGAPQRGGPCVACLARVGGKAPFKSTTKDQERGERRGRAKAIQVARTAAQGDLNRLDKIGSQADEILRRDNERMQRELEMADLLKRNTELMEQIHSDLIKPSDDPEYLKALQTRDKTRERIANKVETVHVVPDGNKTWLGIGLTNPRHHADALEVAKQMGEHFECRVITHEKDAT
jgi:hypothetical protein